MIGLAVRKEARQFMGSSQRSLQGVVPFAKPPVFCVFPGSYNLSVQAEEHRLLSRKTLPRDKGHKILGRRGGKSVDDASSE